MFWRKKKNQSEQEQEIRDDKLLHPDGEPELVAPTEDDADVDSEVPKTEREETENEIVDTLHITPTPDVALTGENDEDSEGDVDGDGGWLSRLGKGLSKSTGKLGQGITDIFTKRRLDEDALQDLEDLLIMSDLGPKTAAEIIAQFSAQKFEKDIEPNEVRIALSDIISGMLEPVAKPFVIEKPDNGPFVILVCGVNGAGKTTTIGKLAHEWHIHQHKKVMIAAADTFRAAAVDQLEVWASRAHVPLFKKDIGADAASVAYESYQKAKEEGVDVLIIDTAGRLQNKVGLMAELEKIVKVLKKHDENLPHAALLVLDATTGQNAISQVKIFKEAVNISGLMVTKLDGSARGGVVVGLAREFGIPIHAVGVGESIEDLNAFDAPDFARALMGL
jgi:fused signal recognition particle receptor